MKIRLIAWEIGSFIWVVLAGSALHFSFELSEFWTPLAFISAVNESVWEHLKMYFWPGLIYALVQYTYTRDIANNYRKQLTRCRDKLNRKKYIIY